MIHFIENEFIKVGVKELGAELTSFYSKAEQVEYLWQGNPEVWYGQSPILFPIVGRLIDDKYTLNGKEYTMPKHGLARKRPFTLIENTGESMTFLQTDTPQTHEFYPYSFELYVKFTICGKKLSVEHTVQNTNKDIMYFSIGAHPAFNCKIGDYLEFDENETLSTEKIDLTESLRLDEKFPVLNNEKKIVITKDIFNEDALILSGIQSDYVTLKSDNHSRQVRFFLGNAPYLGIWAKPGAEYVCIEPWFGVNDSTHKKSDFSQKDEIIALEAGRGFIFTWSAEI